MEIKCPNCSKVASELIVCESCQTVGCSRCMIKTNQRWLCYNCKSGKPVELATEQAKDEVELFSMFE